MKMKWSCIGNEYDHHSVISCAPDKLPEFSVNKDHDSYRAFRSKNVSLQILLQSKASEFLPDSQCPQAWFYAASLKWLDSFKVSKPHF